MTGLMGILEKMKHFDTSDWRLRFAKAGHWLIITILYLAVFSLLDLLSQRFQIYPF